MKKTFILSLIILISIALVGLIASQVYWIDSAIALKKTEFRKEVNKALLCTADKLEKEENFRLMRRMMTGKSMFNRYDSINKAYKNYLKTKNKCSNENRYQDTIISGNKYHIVSRKGNTKNKDKFFISEFRSFIPENGSQDQTFSIEAVLPESDIYNLEHDIYNEVLDKVFFSASTYDFINDYLIPFYRSNPFKNIEDRVNVHFVDSLLNDEFRARGIRALYKFGIYNNFNEPVILSDGAEKYFDEITFSNYQTSLFRNDLLPNNHLIKLFIPNEQTYLLGTMWMMLSTSAILMLTIIIAFSYTIFTILKQKKLSEIKSDFISNMTHELKTPISTISLACQAIEDPDLNISPNASNNFIGMIREENGRLASLVENVLRSAVLEKGEIKLKREPLDLHELIVNAVNKIDLQVKQRGGKIEINLNAFESNIFGDRIHLTNVIFNLLDNANKYSPEAPQITVTTKIFQQFIVLIVKDNGIGISKKNQKKVFENLYRVPTGDIHNVKGFGLGLSYVKNIVELHKGQIEVMSDLGKGSTFKIFIPLHEKFN